MSFVSDLLFGPDEPPAPDYAGAAAVSGESAVEVAQIQQKTERDRLAWAKEKDVAQVALVSELYWRKKGDKSSKKLSITIGTQYSETYKLT